LTKMKLYSSRCNHFLSNFPDISLDMFLMPVWRPGDENYAQPFNSLADCLEAEVLIEVNSFRVEAVCFAKSLVPIFLRQVIIKYEIFISLLAQSFSILSIFKFNVLILRIFNIWHRALSSIRHFGFSHSSN